MHINPPIQTPTIPRAPTKATIDGIPFNAFPTKICRYSYTNVYRYKSLVLEQQLHLDSFKDTQILVLFEELEWIPLVRFLGTAYALIIHLFDSNIIEHDLNESYLKLSLFGIVVEVTPKVGAKVLGIPLVDAPFVSELDVTTELSDRVSIDLWGKGRGQLGTIVHTGSLSRPTWVLSRPTWVLATFFIIFSLSFLSQSKYLQERVYPYVPNASSRTYQLCLLHYR